MTKQLRRVAGCKAVLTGTLLLSAFGGASLASADDHGGGGRGPSHGGGYGHPGGGYYGHPGGGYYGRPGGYGGGPRFNGGYWYHGNYGGYYGWWWAGAGPWLLYPAPIYPGPDAAEVAPSVTLPAPAPDAQMPQVWYWCPTFQGYYPYVKQCPEPWQAVAASAPSDPAGAGLPPAPNPGGGMPPPTELPSAPQSGGPGSPNRPQPYSQAPPGGGYPGTPQLPQSPQGGYGAADPRGYPPAPAQPPAPQQPAYPQQPGYPQQMGYPEQPAYPQQPGDSNREQATSPYSESQPPSASDPEDGNGEDQTPTDPGAAPAGTYQNVPLAPPPQGYGAPANNQPLQPLPPSGGEAAP